MKTVFLILFFFSFKPETHGSNDTIPPVPNDNFTAEKVGQFNFGSAKKYKRVCYFESWAWYRTGDGKMSPDDVDPSLCTHLIYSFAVLDENTLQMKMHDPEIDTKFYKKFTDMKNQALKIMIALGGWNDSKGNKYSRMVRDAASRKRFIDHAVRFLETHNFDGLDLDWEYPACPQGNCNAGSHNDKRNFGLLVKELNVAFKPKGVVLSAAVAAGTSKIDAAYDVPMLSKYLDFINVMAYDFHGHWDAKTGVHAALYATFDDADKSLSVRFSISHWIKKGAAREKLILGIPLYGRSFTLVSAAENGINAPAVRNQGPRGPITGEDGLLAFFEICYGIKQGGWTIKDRGGHSHHGRYAFKNKEWVSYDDIKSIKDKCKYIKYMGLGGGMVWALDHDDFRNRCGDGRNPLLKAIKDELTTAKGITTTEVVTTTESSSGDTTCPKTHKYAYRNGAWCCQTNKDCKDKPITLNSDCCQYWAYKECPEMKCTNHPSVGPEETCADDKTHCNYWKEQGFCERSHVSFMQRYCKKSCGVC